MVVPVPLLAVGTSSLTWCGSNAVVVLKRGAYLFHEVKASRQKRSGNSKMKDPTTWAHRRIQLAERYKASRNKRKDSLRVYSNADFDRIAKALGKSPSTIRSYKLSFENCAFWYRAGHGFGKRRAEKIPPSKMYERVARIRKAANRFLETFEVRADSDDGVGEGALGQQIFEALTWVGPDAAEAVAHDLRQLGLAREAATNLLKRAEAAAAEIEKSELKSYSQRGKVGSKGKWSVPDGNQNDAILNDWVACSMCLYEEITGQAPKTSVRGPEDKRAGEADGPLLRFLVEAGKPLGIRQSKDALRARFRRLRDHKEGAGICTKTARRKHRQE